MDKEIYLDLIRSSMTTLMTNVEMCIETMEDENISLKDQLFILEKKVLAEEIKIRQLMEDTNRLRGELIKLKDKSKQVESVVDSCARHIDCEYNGNCPTPDKCPSPNHCCFEEDSEEIDIEDYTNHGKHCDDCEYNSFNGCPDIPDCPPEYCCYITENKDEDGDMNEVE